MTELILPIEGIFERSPELDLDKFILLEEISPVVPLKLFFFVPLILKVFSGLPPDLDELGLPPGLFLFFILCLLLFLLFSSS